MTFDNSPPPTASRLQIFKDHLPILLVVGGALTLFISSHIAAWTVAIAAGAHIAVGALLAAAAWYKNRGSQ